MRIIAGRFRGRALAAIGKGDPAAHLRPTTDRVRESLFSMLSGGRFGDPITDARVLDLFAGTGALGLEALSRGATLVTFVENGVKALALLRRNVEICDATQDITIIKRDATRMPACTHAPFDLIFLDPPYGKGLGGKALRSAIENNWIAPGALIVWEESHPEPPPPGYVLLDQRRYGDTHISLMEAPT